MSATKKKTVSPNEVVFTYSADRPARVMRAPNGKLYVVDGSIAHSKADDRIPVVVWRAWPVVALRTCDPHGARGTLPTEGAKVGAPVWLQGRGVTTWSVVGDVYALVDTRGDAYLLAETPLVPPKTRTADAIWDHLVGRWRVMHRNRVETRPALAEFIAAIPAFVERADDAAIR